MSHFGISGAYPVFACSLLLAVCVAILWASEHEETLCAWIDRFVAWIFPEVNPDDIS